jgi:plastocyanin
MMSVNLRSLGISSLAIRFAVAAAIALRLGAAHAEDTNSVTIDNFTFAPPEMTVKVGTTVTWTNHDDIPHTIVSAGKFRSKTLDTDNSFSFTFTAAGDYKYFCSLHPHMTGTIKVE